MGTCLIRKQLASALVIAAISLASCTAPSGPPNQAGSPGDEATHHPSADTNEVDSVGNIPTRSDARADEEAGLHDSNREPPPSDDATREPELDIESLRPTDSGIADSRSEGDSSVKHEEIPDSVNIPDSPTRSDTPFREPKDLGGSESGTDEGETRADGDVGPPPNEADATVPADADSAGTGEDEDQSPAPEEETLCPEWQAAFSLDDEHDHCADFEVTDEVYQAIIPVPVSCPVPYPIMAELDATYDIRPEVYVFTYSGVFGQGEGYWGEIKSLAVPTGDSVVVAYTYPEQNKWFWDDNFNDYMRDNLRFRTLASDASTLQVFDFGSSGMTETLNWLKAGPSGKLWTCISSESGFEANPQSDVTTAVLEVVDGGLHFQFAQLPYAHPDFRGLAGVVTIDQTGLLTNTSANQSDKEKNPCFTMAFYHYDISGAMQWLTTIGTFGQKGPSVTYGAGSNQQLTIAGCGYVLAAVTSGENIGPSVPPSATLRIPSFRFFTTKGTYLGSRRYLAGYWGFASVYADTHGKEVVTARSIDGTIQAPTFAGQKVGVLRLNADGSVKWFSVLTEPGGFDALYADSILALPSGLTVVSCTVDTLRTKVYVLDPDGCVVANYTYGTVGAPEGTNPEHMYHLHRLADGRFVAHDKFRVFFFSLPAVEEWEAANAPTP